MGSKHTMKNWKLINDKIPLKGSLNMAIDEYLFLSLNENPRTLVRFYQWEKPTVSLGYSQKISNVLNIRYCQDQGIDVVRRITGGKLVLHHNEITYSFCSSDSQTFTSSLQPSYRLISQALIRGLEKMELKPSLAEAAPSRYKKGNLPCFSYPALDEIEIAGKKIVGSAQRRIGRRFIQHGSIPLDEDYELLKSVSLMDKVELDLHSTSLSHALGHPVSFDWAVEHLRAGVSEYFGVNLKPRSFKPREWEIILRIQKERYEDENWTLKGLDKRSVDFFNGE
jgi:lipoate-protein ligase A